MNCLSSEEMPDVLVNSGCKAPMTNVFYAVCQVAADASFSDAFSPNRAEALRESLEEELAAARRAAAAAAAERLRAEQEAASLDSALAALQREETDKKVAPAEMHSAASLHLHHFRRSIRLTNVCSGHQLDSRHSIMQKFCAYTGESI
jgi:hypothetical protein